MLLATLGLSVLSPTASAAAGSFLQLREPLRWEAMGLRGSCPLPGAFLAFKEASVPAAVFASTLITSATWLTEINYKAF